MAENLGTASASLKVDVAGAIADLGRFRAAFAQIPQATKAAASQASSALNQVQESGARSVSGVRAAVSRAVSGVSSDYAKITASAKQSAASAAASGAKMKDSLELTGAANDAVADVKRVSSAFDQLGGNAVAQGGRAREAVGRIGGGLKGFLRDTAAVGIGTFIGGSGLLDAVLSPIKTGAFFETAEKQLTTAMGSVDKAKAAIVDLRQVAKESPFEFPGLVNMAQQFESLGLPYKQWTNTVLDTAAATGKSVDQTTQAVLDAGVGEFERLKEFGIRTLEESGKTYFQYQQNGKTIRKEIDRNNSEMVQSTLQAIWNDKYKGAMAAQAKTFQGQWSTLKDSINLTLAQVGQPLFDFAKKGLTVINSVFDSFGKFRGQGQGFIGSLFSGLREGLDTAFGTGTADKFSAALTTVETTLKLVGAAVALVKNNMDLLLPVVVAVGAAFLVMEANAKLQGAIAGVKALNAAIAGLGASNPILLALIAVFAALSFAYTKNLFGFGDAVDSVAGRIKRFGETWKRQFDWVSKTGNYSKVTLAFRALGLALSGILGLNPKKVVDFFTGFGRAVDRPLQGLKKMGEGLLGIGKSILSGDFRGAMEQGRKLLAGFGDVLASPAKAVGQFLKGIETGFKPLDSVLNTAGKLFTDWGRLVQEVFQGDLSGALDVAERAFGHLGDLGQQAWALLVAGFNAINWGGIWDTVTSGISTAAGKVVDLVDWSVNVGAPRVLSWLGEGVSGIWDWLQGQMGLAGGTVGDGTGGPETDRAPISLTDWVLDVAMPSITGWLKSAAEDAWPALKLAAGWVGTNLFRFGAWELTVAIPSIGGWLKNVAPDVWKGLQQAAGWALQKTFQFESWKLNVAAPAILGWLNDHKDDIWQGLKTAARIPGQIVGAVNDWVLNVGAPKLGGWLLDIGGNLSGWLVGKLTGGNQRATGLFNDAGDQIFGSDAGGSLSSAIAGWITGELSDLRTKVSGWKDEILAEIGKIVPDSLPDLNLPEFTINTGKIQSVVEGVIKKIEGWTHDIRTALADLLFWKNQGGDDSNVTLGGDTGGLGGSPGQQRAGTLGPQEGSAPASQGPVAGDTGQRVVKIPAPDTSLFDTGMAGLKQKLIDFSTTKAQAKLDADSAPAIRQLASTGKLVTAWNALTATAKLAFDNGLAAIGYTEAFGWGDVFRKQIFTAILDFDNGPAAVAYTDAYGWGDTFDGTTFSARLSFDTSALDAALDHTRSVMQQISDLLPHSPAKVGPLAREIKFDYIVDSLKRSMRSLDGVASRGMDAVAGMLPAPALGRSVPLPAPHWAGGSNQTIHVTQNFQLRRAEFEDYLGKAEAGAYFAEHFGEALVP